MKKVLCLAAVALILLVGCRSPNQTSPNQTIWSAQTASPDGTFVAFAHTENVAGPGMNAQWTSVSLQQSYSGAKPLEVLTLDEGTGSVKNLTMHWLSPTHLEITYKGDVKILFQAVKCFALDISVRNLPD